MRLSKAPLDFEPLPSSGVHFRTQAYCPVCDRSMATYQRVYQDMMFADPDAEEEAEVAKANSPWTAKKDPTPDLTYAPPPLEPAIKKMPLFQVEHMRKNKPAQRWAMRGLIRRAYHKALRASEEPPKPKRRKESADNRHQYPRLVTTYRCDSCGFRADHDTSNGYLPWCLHNGTTVLGTSKSIGIKIGEEKNYEGSGAELMRWVGVSYQPSVLYPQPASAPYRVESQMLGFQRVVRRVPATTPSDHERELDAAVEANWDTWQGRIAAWARERDEQLRAPDNGEPRWRKQSVAQEDAERVAVRERWAVWAKSNARALRGPHPLIEEVRLKLLEGYVLGVPEPTRKEPKPAPDHRPPIGPGILAIRWEGKTAEQIVAEQQRELDRAFGQPVKAWAVRLKRPQQHGAALFKPDLLHLTARAERRRHEQEVQRDLSSWSPPTELWQEGQFRGEFWRRWNARMPQPVPVEPSLSESWWDKAVQKLEKLLERYRASPGQPARWRASPA